MTFTPIIMKDVVLVFGSDETGGTAFQCQARSVTLNPDVNIQRTKTLCPTGQFSDVDTPEWTLEVGYLYGTSDVPATEPAFADFLLENQGVKMNVFFRPVAGGAGYQVSATLLPGGIGGEQGSFSEQSVSLPVDGQPAALAPPV